MQPLSGPGVPVGDRSSVNAQTGVTRHGSVAGEQPLSPAQRTTLERLIVRISSLSNLKAPELWAGVRHEVGVKSEAELQSRHF
ncbi:flagella biosynthesis regulator Flk, partial [Pantoea agglomerans]